MLELRGVSMTFNEGTADENRALRNINLSINDGEFITVIGSNGAGKTTLYNVIAGTYIPTSGSVLFDTGSGVRDVTREKEYRRALHIGRIFQNPLLGTAGKMSLEDNMIIAYKKGFKGLRISLNAKTRSLFRKQLAMLGMGLEDRMEDNVELLSGGQRQAVTLLMAVMSRPRLLLLDEHTAALDPANADLVMDLTRRFAHDFHLTVMMVTHNMQQALDAGTRMLMMDRGEIIMDISGDEKRSLSMDDIIQKFRAIKGTTLTNDEMLLQ